MKNKFYENVKMLRMERGISQGELGEIVGVSQQCVSKWEAGKSEPTLTSLWRLADLFGVSIDILCGRTDW